jgi:hypothetical protein
MGREDKTVAGYQFPVAGKQYHSCRLPVLGCRENNTIVAGYQFSVAGKNTIVAGYQFPVAGKTIP